MTANISRISVLGVPVDLFTADQFIQFLIESASFAGRKTTVGYANIYEANLADDLPSHMAYLNRADGVFLDGIGLLIGARLLGYKVRRQHRISGPDFLETLVRECEQRCLSIYLLGGEPEVLSASIAKLRRFAPSLVVHGHHGFFRKTGEENDAIVADINMKAPEILYVGLGSPVQEAWIAENIDRVNARVFLPMGAGLDHYTGRKKRAPKWLTDRGAEWLFRLGSDPRRLWKRYLIGNPRFFARILVCLLTRVRDAVVG